MTIKDLLVLFARVITGALFTFSGFVKSVDPMGSAIKFEEYFISFGMEWLSFGALTFAVLLSAVELMLGLMLILGVFKRVTAWASMIFMLFFTVLTIFIYFTSPVEDCGCFGDAVVLSNGATLLKNIIFTLILLPYFLKYRFHKSRRCKRTQGIVALVVGVIALAPSIYAVEYLPLIDFLPYKIGVNIQQAMSIPEGEKEDVYDTKLVYKNLASGKEHSFALTDTTWYDTSKWSYVDTKTELIERGYEPTISNFNIFDIDGNDVTERLLAPQKRVAIIVIDDKIVTKGVAKNIQDIDLWCKANSVEMIVFTKFNIDEMRWIVSNIVDYNFTNIYNGDHTLIKSLIRAPFGLVTLDGGTIKEKFNLQSGSCNISFGDL